MIVAPPGKRLVACDFSQAETWIVAYKCGSELMKKELRYGDIHTRTASGLFYPDSQCLHTEGWKKLPSGDRTCPACEIVITEIQRYTGKRINHAKSYRMGDPRFAQVYNKDAGDMGAPPISTPTARLYGQRWLALYTEIPSWWSAIETELSIARTLWTTYGRRRVFYAHWGDELFKEATAYEPQSTVADHANGILHPELGIPGGFITVYRRIAKQSNGEISIVNVAHDSIMLECPNNVAEDVGKEVVSILRRPLIIAGEEVTIPVDLEIGDRWSEGMDKIKLAS
jgi:DNA polymerase I-like protein with 3'-5' exonuclease and polymerase domains